LAALKTETLIYQCFYFAKTAKNAILGSLLLRSAHNSDKWRFNASFVPLACDFRMILGSFCARKNLDKWYNASAVVLLNSMQKKQQIRNSTAEFLIFAMQGDAEGIEVRLRMILYGSPEGHGRALWKLKNKCLGAYSTHIC
jgi:hypothetical protein